jgi:hypothetical protein
MESRLALLSFLAASLFPPYGDDTGQQELPIAMLFIPIDILAICIA